LALMAYLANRSCDSIVVISIPTVRGHRISLSAILRNNNEQKFCYQCRQCGGDALRWRRGRRKSDQRSLYSAISGQIRSNCRVCM